MTLTQMGKTTGITHLKKRHVVFEIVIIYLNKLDFRREACSEDKNLEISCVWYLKPL